MANNSLKTAPPEKMLLRPDGTKLAFHCNYGNTPGVIFFPGLKSDMAGLKAKSLELACIARGRSFIRFDYFGHGRSDGAFKEGTIGRWTEDAIAILDEIAVGPQILVGSSMGGWIMLLAALARLEKVKALLGIAAAPDFTESIWTNADKEMKHALQSDGFFLQSSPYDTEATPISLNLIKEARAHLVLTKSIPIRSPIRLLHGMEDSDVPWQTSLELAKKLESTDVVVKLLKDGDHRLSSKKQITLMIETLENLCQKFGNDS